MTKSFITATIIISLLASSAVGQEKYQHPLVKTPDTLATRQDSLQLIRARYQGGVANLLDVRQAEELVYEASKTIPDTERFGSAGRFGPCGESGLLPQHQPHGARRISKWQALKSLHRRKPRLDIRATGYPADLHRGPLEIER